MLSRGYFARVKISCNTAALRTVRRNALKNFIFANVFFISSDLFDRALITTIESPMGDFEPRLDHVMW